MLREWDPSTASDEELASMVDTMNEVWALDLPNDPPWCTDRVREYFAVTLPGERRITWLASDDTGERLHGHASLLLTDDIGVLEILVHPQARRHGVGTRLLGAAAFRAAREGVEALGVEVAGNTSSVSFYQAHGFRCAYTELRSVLNLSRVDWTKVAVMATGIGAGYHMEYHPGGPPSELFARYAATKVAARDLEYRDGGDLDLRPSSYQPDRLAASVHTLQARGLKPYVVVAIHEPTGAVAGLTEVVVPAQRPTRADQYDTIVDPTHRGYGIDRALRARILIELRDAEPDLVDVQTWDALENTQMQNINSELGFRAEREWHEYDVKVSTLIRSLSRRS